MASVQELRIEIEFVGRLYFDDGSPVRAASGIARFGEGWLIVQDDSTQLAWRHGASVEAVRVFPPIEGLDHFSEAAGTKHLKPDLESACRLSIDGDPAVLVFGSASSPARRRAALIRLVEGRPVVQSVDLGPLYDRAATVLGLDAAELNIEGASCDGSTLRWFNRGNHHAGVASGSVDLELEALLDVFDGGRSAASVAVSAPRHYRLGMLGGVGLSVTDALDLGEGRVLVSAAAEDTPNNVDDGPVLGVVLALLDGATVLASGAVPEIDGAIQKIEGLAIEDRFSDGVRVVAVVDADDPELPSLELLLRLSWD